MRSFFKRGNGATLVGVYMIMLFFALAILLADEFNFFDAQIKAQTHTDALVDAMAVALDNQTGEPNYPYMQLIHDPNNPNSLISAINHINPDYFQITDVNYNPSLLGNPNNRILSVSTEVKAKFLNSGFYFNTNDPYYLTLSGHNTTRVLIDSTNNSNYRYSPAITDVITAQNRIMANASIPTTRSRYRNIIGQFEVETTRRYKAYGLRSKADVFLWDTTRALRCEIPLLFYYDYNDPDNSRNGQLWPASQGRITDNDDEGHRYRLDDFVYSVEMPDPNAPEEPEEEGEEEDAPPPTITVNYEGLYGFGKRFFSQSINKDISLPSQLPNSISPYRNWRLLGNEGTLTYNCKEIQKYANAGYPTIIAFANHCIWIVLPEAETRNPSIAEQTNKVLVAHAAVVEDIPGAAFNIDTLNRSTVYRNPGMYGTFDVYVYNPHSGWTGI